MIKVDIISGFLGAGKTTLISKLLKDKSEDEKVVLIENEFGEIGIDKGFLKNTGININEINSGCICCSLVGDFYEALLKVIDEYKPDRIIIEPSGVGKLSDIIKVVKRVEGIKLNIYSTVVDAGKAKLYSKNFREFFNDQIESASCVILSKTQLTSQEKKAEALNIIKEINPNVKVVTTDWEVLDTKTLIEVMENSIKKKHHHEHDENCECWHHHEHDDHCECEHHHEHDENCESHNGETCSCGHNHEHHHHDADEVFESYGYETINKYSKEEIEDILNNMDEKVIRAKGIVEDKDGGWLFFDYVPQLVDVRKGEPNYTGLITIISTKDLDIEPIKKKFGVN